MTSRDTVEMKIIIAGFVAQIGGGGFNLWSMIARGLNFGQLRLYSPAVILTIADLFNMLEWELSLKRF